MPCRFLVDNFNFLGFWEKKITLENGRMYQKSDWHKNPNLKTIFYMKKLKLNTIINFKVPGYLETRKYVLLPDFKNE